MRILSPPARTFLDIVWTGTAALVLVTLLSVSNTLSDWQVLLSLFLQTHTCYALAERKVCPISLDVFHHYSQSNTQIFPFISQRNARKARREKIFILTLLIRKELNLSGNSRSFFSFRHTVKSILRSDYKSCKISYLFKAVFHQYYNQGQERSQNSSNTSPHNSRWEWNF